ncbi:DNA adenine methylase [Paenibacillus macerans]|uniref:DNA adenine methylase n=1 Tax=Paenibacillus macerans TaxID=44252 RepID=A0A6N8F0K6_PAEMA|nr:DNA adenine methylase [Paenibacillus macerans]MUG26017.1 DNA adenine methylase [Paenibacillus macerans]
MKSQRILHYPGSKWSMTDWIIDNMPDHQTYLEPFFGSGAVFFNKKPATLETINDLDGDIVNLFRVIRECPGELAKLVHWTPYSREEYYASYETGGGELEQARRFLVRCWMARGARSSSRNGWRHIIDHNGPRPVKQWNDVPEKILSITNRLKGVQIEQQPAIQLIKRYKRPEVLIYADPPYVLETRHGRIYKHEMQEEDHIELLDVLDEHPGPVILSGYAHPLYDNRLSHWERETKIVTAEAAQHRTEVLWINPVASKEIKRLYLF